MFGYCVVLRFIDSLVLVLGDTHAGSITYSSFVYQLSIKFMHNQDYND